MYIVMRATAVVLSAAGVCDCSVYYYDVYIAAAVKPVHNGHRTVTRDHRKVSTVDGWASLLFQSKSHTRIYIN